MRRILVLLLASFTCAAFIHVNVTPKNQLAIAPQDWKAYKKGLSLGCRPDLAAIDFGDPANQIPLLTGWGSYRMPVTSKNDSAYIYFQQGINMYYGFHIIEALASFEKSVSFDSAFAMGYWGKALAYGPNINDLGYAASPEALAAMEKAKSLSNNCTPVEKALIDAIQVRYAADSSAVRTHLDQLYADAMKKVHAAFPHSADAAALYADALMVQHPWDLYDSASNPKRWTPEIVRVLEKLVALYPQNPGANHYYIHAIEGSKNPGKALKIANRLGAFMPGVAHLVHMPSHIYIRTGLYRKGMAVNNAAVEGYEDYLSKYPVVANGAFIYLIHNLHMKAACAAMGADYQNAVAYSLETRNSIDSAYITSGGYFGMYSQFLYMTPVFTQIRFGNWDQVLGTPDLPEAWVYARGMQHFARGLAYARTHQLQKAAIELAQMDDSTQSTILQDHPPAFNPGIVAIDISYNILQGVIEEEKGNYAEAIAYLQLAVKREDNMKYNEPKDWLLPARQYLGNALLKAGKYSEAEKVYHKDLLINPNNSWSLAGLADALQKQSKQREADRVQEQLRNALNGNKIAIKSSVF